MKAIILILITLSCSLLLSTVFNVNLLLPNNPAAFQYNTIAGAYNAAANGDEINIFPGDYPESISVSKSLTIKGTTAGSARIVSNNTDGITINAGNVIVSNLAFKCPGGAGIKLPNSTCPPVIIRDCLFDYSLYGVHVTTTSTITIQNCIIRNCTNGIYITTFQNDVSGLISNCVFHNNAKAIFFEAEYGGADYDIDIYNSVFVINASGINKENSPTYLGVIDYNIFYNNSTNNIYGVNWASNNIVNVNPVLGNIVGTPYYNYFPTSGSPCINAGNIHIDYNDLDGTRNDIGIFGGQYQWGSNKPVVLDIQVTPNIVQQGGTFNLQTTGQSK